MQIAQDQFWQKLYRPEELSQGVQPGGTAYAATLPDGRRILLPIRILPGGGDRAVASLIVNQASFAVLDALADVLADRLKQLRPEMIVAVPTLGLPLAEAVARRLGHARMVALGTSAKFWYDKALSEPLRSITTPDQEKRIYVDPRMLALLQSSRVAVVDDVVSSGASMVSVLRLLRKAGVAPVAIGAAMLQGEAWRARMAGEAPGLPVIGAITTPILGLDGPQWRPV